MIPRKTWLVLAALAATFAPAAGMAAAAASHPRPHFLAGSSAEEWKAKLTEAADSYKADRLALDKAGLSFLPMDEDTACFSAFVRFERNGNVTFFEAQGAEPGNGEHLPSAMPFRYSKLGARLCSFDEATMTDRCEPKPGDADSEPTFYLRYLDEAGTHIAVGASPADAAAPTAYTQQWHDCSRYGGVLMQAVAASAGQAVEHGPATARHAWIEQNLLMDPSHAAVFLAAIAAKP